MMSRLIIVLFVCGMAVGANAATASSDNVVLQWNSALLQAIRNTAFPPMHAARAFAIVHTCMYDAWAPYTAKAVGTRLGETLRRPASEHTHDNKTLAVSVQDRSIQKPTPPGCDHIMLAL